PRSLRSMRPLAASVIVCTYSERRWDDLVAAVGSLRRQHVRPDEVVVAVDNNPPLAARVRDELPDVVVVENRSDRGLSSARNAGIAAARGDVVAFLDDDAVAEPDWLATLLAWYADARVLGERPVGCEETELCIRALQQSPGRMLVYEPEARVGHQVPAARGRLRYFLSRCFAEGLSKAAVVELRGSRVGLESERRYALCVLP